jgi:hypothetical protein
VNEYFEMIIIAGKSADLLSFALTTKYIVNRAEDVMF